MPYLHVVSYAFSKSKKTATTCSFLTKASRMKVSNLTKLPIRNTGPCFHLSLPRQRGQRDAHILHALSLPGHPLRVTEKATHGEQVGLYPWHSQTGTSITINIVPKCEVCPRDHGKVVESLRGKLKRLQSFSKSA